MKILPKSIITVSLSMFMMMSCSSTKKNDTDRDGQSSDSVAVVMNFNADSAYRYIKDQCDFGFRVPNTEAHRKCGDYLAARLKAAGANVIEQKARLKTFDGTMLDARNIIGEFNGSATQRILLLSHWDSRPWADNDADISKRSEPVMAANDGASGVGVLLEIARLMAQKMPDIGVDIMFVDAEDWGDSSDGNDTEDTWALGTQYWAANMHRDGYKPMFGILLDMVGSASTSFTQDYYSLQYAGGIVNEVWNIAGKSGYGDYFKARRGGAITDDHLFVNRAGIPCIDIIGQDENSETGFFSGWHTTHDTIDAIDPATLKAVGQTLVNLIYQY